MPRHDLLDWIALNLLPGLGPVSRMHALRRFESPGTIAFSVPPAELRAIMRRVPAQFEDRVRDARRALRRDAETEWKRCRRANIDIIVRSDPAYPTLLGTIHAAPTLLYVRGKIDPSRPGVALVGARRATTYGRRIAAELAYGLAAAGVAVVSGGARGVDTAAHRGALEAGGTTVVVLGSGVARPYPSENRALFHEVAANGAVVSEFPLDLAPRPETFPQRNRIIAGLSAAVVVVEAADKSGSLITARMGLESGREVMAVPGPVSSDRSAGCHRLIRAGAGLVRHSGDVLDEIRAAYGADLPDASSPTGLEGGSRKIVDISQLTEDERLVFECLDPVEPLHLDDLADRMPFGIARLQTALFGLELRSAVDPLPGRYYCSQLPKEP